MLNKVIQAYIQVAGFAGSGVNKPIYSRLFPALFYLPLRPPHLYLSFWRSGFYQRLARGSDFSSTAFLPRTQGFRYEKGLSSASF